MLDMSIITIHSLFPMLDVSIITVHSLFSEDHREVGRTSLTLNWASSHNVDEHNIPETVKQIL